MEFRNDRPIYLQIMEDMRVRVASGQWPPGSKIASVRDLAEQMSVNPNTMQRALGELEREGLLKSERTSGRFVTVEKSLIQNLRHSLGREKIRLLLAELRELGYSREEILTCIQQEETTDEHLA